MNNKTYILLKDTPEAKAGTEFHFVPNKNTLDLYMDGDKRFGYEPHTVENQPEWFKPKEEKGWTDLDMVKFAIFATEYFHRWGNISDKTLVAWKKRPKMPR